MDKILSVRGLSRVKPPLIEFHMTRLNGNHHRADGDTLRLTFLLVRMGSFAKSWGLWLYGRSGACVCLQVTFPRTRGLVFPKTWSWPKGRGRS
jgi:hypothetical protein